jgi:small subunit ribosomal protein S2
MPKKAAERERLLIPREKYLAAGAHIGMTSKVAQMKKFIYKVRPNGLAVLNIGELDKRLSCAGAMLALAKKPLVVSRKDIGWDPVRKFCELTGAKMVLGRFMPGSLTNPSYKHYTEPDLVIVVDPIADRQAILEAADTRVPIIGLADTSHDPAFLDVVLPCNNKGKKAIALVFWGLASAMFEKQGKPLEAKLEDFGWGEEESIERA